jgi:RNA recognition motif-containing protein
LLYLDTGFAFIYMEDERDAEDAIRGLDRVEFGRKGRRLRVEWTKVTRYDSHGFIFCLIFYVLKLCIFHELTCCNCY